MPVWSEPKRPPVGSIGAGLCGEYIRCIYNRKGCKGVI